MQDQGLRVAIAVRVVDNFGDAGVAWRLARQLVAEFGCEVTLWIDDRGALARFLPGYDAGCHDALIEGVRIRALPGRERAPAPPGASLEPWPHLVVEAFGCALPEGWLDAMERSRERPVWVNLEYLSAEDWVEGTHGLRSPHPTRDLARWFYFPGFTARTGGLLRERTLAARRDAFRAARDCRERPWRSVGLAPPDADAMTVSIFCYPDGALAPLLRAWRAEPRPVACIVPEGVASAAVEAVTGRAARAGTTHTDGSLTLAVVPFVDQDTFDARLWACDWSIVRGEDSFVRAQWAERPFVWHIYPQADDAHRAKLDAFLRRYAEGLGEREARSLAAFTHAFNDGDGAATVGRWPAFARALPALSVHARRWAAALAGTRDLASQLVDFARNRI